MKVFLNVESDIKLEEEGPTYNPGPPPLIVDEPEDEGPTYSPDSPLIVDEPEDDEKDDLLNDTMKDTMKEPERSASLKN